MVGLVRTEPVLRRRALHQALMFAAFSVFCSTIASELVAAHGLSQTGIGLFALVGAAGAATAPLAGRLGDRGHSRAGTGVAFGPASGALMLAALVPGCLPALAVAAVGLDGAVQTSLVLGQRAVCGLRPEARSRLNTISITTFLVGGAVGSAVGGLLFDARGRRASTLVGAALLQVGLLVWAFERRSAPARHLAGGEAPAPDTDR